jgi:hypothetical protein
VFPAYPAFRRKAEEARAATLPFLCIHAKSLVVDARVAFVGSFNLDPRSERLNTEVGVLVEDEFVAAQLREEILRDTRPGNSWTVARTARPLRLDALNALLEGLSGLSPVDVWPIRNTSSFELIPGKAPVPPDHPDFYGNYRNAGSFPGAAAALSVKEIVARLYKAVAGAATPLL